MKVFKLSKVEKEEFKSPIFEGGVVKRQVLVTPQMGKNYNCAVVNFSKGATTVPHTHSSDQLLFVLSGEGVVGNEKEGNVTVKPGDFVFSPAGEKHWHGATKNSEFSHLMVLSADNKTDYKGKV